MSPPRLFITIMAKLTSDQHDDYRKDLLRVSVRCYISETDGRQTAKSEVKRRDIATLEKRKLHRVE